MADFKPISLSLFLFLLLSLSVSVSSHGGSHDHDEDDAAASESSSSLRSKALILVKIWCLIIIFVGTFAGGISPYFLKWNEGFLILGTQFAGGIFLGTAMMHFLSDSAETFGDLTHVEYPFAFMLACAGYLMTMMADCVVSLVYAKKSVGRGDAENGDNAPEVKLGSHGGLSHSHLQVNNDGTAVQVGKPLAMARSLGDNILLIAALCFHSVFEGIAIGVAESKADAWKALWTICLHKIFAAIAMGIALLRMVPNRPLLSCIAYAFAFAISSPIGIAIGIIIDATTQGVVADWIFAISMGLATGVFIYVSINHLISKGFMPQRSAALNTPSFNLLAVTLGF
ncbi:hypothetical protein ACLOJK_000031 [Asimina triloba]